MIVIDINLQIKVNFGDSQVADRENVTKRTLIVYLGPESDQNTNFKTSWKIRQIQF